MEIFIAGSSRSGTTLMARILGRHDQVHTLSELHFFEQIWDPGGPADLDEKGLADMAARIISIAEGGYFHPHDPRRYRDEAIAVVEREAESGSSTTALDVFFRVLHQEALKNGASVPCEHTPRNAFFMREILDASPDARIIAMVRDPRDVVLSQRAKWRRRRLSGRSYPIKEAFRAALAYHPINVAILWRGAIRALQAVRGNPRVFVVRYEDLVRDAKAVTREVCEFLDLDWGPDLLEVERRGSSRSRDDRETTGVYAHRAVAWREASRREQADVALCQWVCRGEMASYGYELEGLRVPWLWLVMQLATWPLRSGLGLLINLRRVKSPLRAIRVRLSR